MGEQLFPDLEASCRHVLAAEAAPVCRREKHAPKQGSRALNQLAESKHDETVQRGCPKRYEIDMQSSRSGTCLSERNERDAEQERGTSLSDWFGVWQRSVIHSAAIWLPDPADIAGVLHTSCNNKPLSSMGRR